MDTNKKMSIDDRINITCALDNLGKGASGAAIESMNIVLGLDPYVVTGLQEQRGFQYNELTFGDRVLGEVENNSFIALPGKAGHISLMPSKLCPNLD